MQCNVCFVASITNQFFVPAGRRTCFDVTRSIGNYGNGWKLVIIPTHGEGVYLPLQGLLRGSQGEDSIPLAPVDGLGTCVNNKQTLSDWITKGIKCIPLLCKHLRLYVLWCLASMHYNTV